MWDKTILMIWQLILYISLLIILIIHYNKFVTTQTEAEGFEKVAWPMILESPQIHTHWEKIERRASI